MAKYLNNKYWLYLVFIFIITFITYSVSLHSPFVYDDLPNITRNPAIKHLENLLVQLNLLIKQGRPLTYFTFSINYYFSKLDTLGYHLINLIIHIINIILVFVLTKKIVSYSIKKYTLLFPFIVSIIFAIHPINTEVVTYIYNRSSSLSTLFYLLSILFFIKTFEKNRYYYFLSLISFILSFLAKETAATLPLIIIVFDYIFLSNYSLKKVINKKFYHIPFWIILIFLFIYSSFYQIEQSNFTYEQKTIWFQTQLWVITKFFKLLIIPHGLSIDHSFEAITNILEPRALISTFIIMLIIIFTWKIYSKRTEFSKIILFSILSFFITLLPTLIFIVHIGERHLYLPAIGFYLVIGCIFISLNENLFYNYRAVFYTLVALYILILSILTVKRNQLYNNPVLLWQDVINQYPNNICAHNNLGTIYLENKDYENAKSEFEKVLELNPNDKEALNNLGTIYSELEQHENAIIAFKKIIETNPEYAEAHNNLGTLFREKKEYDKALNEYYIAIKLKPDYVSAYNNIGILYYLQKEYNKAENMFKKAIEINPDYIEAHNNLGNLYSLTGQYDKSISEFKKTIEIDTNYFLGYINLGTVYIAIKDYDNALKIFMKSIKINPKSNIPHYHLGNIFYLQKKYDESINEFKLSIKLDPNHAESYNNLSAVYYTLGDLINAKNEIIKSLKINSDYIDAHINLANIYLAEKQNQLALKEYQIILKLDPENKIAKNMIKVLLNK